MKRLAEEERDRFRTLFLQYYPKVDSFLTALLKDEAAAKDLAQDVFVHLWEERAKLSAIRSFEAYLFSMARNAALNYMKHAAFTSDRLADESEAAPEVPSGEERLYAREEKLLVDLAVSRMPPQRQRIYRMSREEGLKNDEIATRLGLSKKTVENHLNLALGELRKVILSFGCEVGLICLLK
ncbi:MAG: RNA polymerase sigma-70 factor [Tannerella sp.]|nr:RNA polymerase sigma-70 factor [Tannerella sp.]